MIQVRSANEETKRKEDLTDPASEESILDLAVKRYDMTVEAERHIVDAAIEDTKFALGDQWREEDRKLREVDRRPCLTINRLPQHLRQVINDSRQNRPSIKIFPVDDGADIETAKIYSGLIRHIQLNSNADVAFDTALEGAVRGGRGFFRILTQFVHPMSFDQELLIKRIADPLTVKFDPFSTEPDGSDANFCFIEEDMPNEEFKAKYPNSKLCNADGFADARARRPGWISDKSVRVVEYYRREYTPTTIVLLSNGSVVEKSKLAKELAPGVTIVKERETLMLKVLWVKTNGYEILEETEWPGQWIPVIPVIGEEIWLEGKRHLESLIRHAKDPQRMVNVWTSYESEVISIAPKVPWIGYAGQFKNFEKDWQEANVRNMPYLQVNPVMVNGQVAPLPQRNAYEPPIQAITQAKLGASDDIKSTTGQYDNALGNRSNETSGRAINARAAQAQTGTFHFTDNLNRSIRHAGRICVAAIPHIYDTARTSVIIGEEGEKEVVRINQEFEKPNGEVVNYFLSRGKYDVSVETGPSYATKRAEASFNMMEMARAYPPLMEIAGDLVTKNFDWPGATEISERMKMLPSIAAVAKDPNQKPLPPQVQAQLAQQGQMIEQLSAQLAAATQEIQTKKFELESKERIANLNAEIKVKTELLKQYGAAANAVLDREMNNIDRRQELLRDDEPIIPNSNGSDPNSGVAPEEQQLPGEFSPVPPNGEIP